MITFKRTQLFVFVAVACVLLPFYRYELGPDGISYLSVASEYAHGYWRDAVNPYWGPFYSWLLAFLLVLRVPGIVATRLVAIASGALALYALDALCRRLPMRLPLQQIFLWLTALVLLSYVIGSDTPDVLFTALLLLYTAVIFHPAYPIRYAGLFCGVLGALSFYTKSYGFAFFVSHFCVITAVVYWLRGERQRRREIVQQFVIGLVCFFILSAGWIFVLHAKYGIWTLGTSGEFNHRLVGPESAGYPHLRRSIPPQREHDITSWQNPSPAWLPAWSAVRDARHEAKLVALNVHEVAYFWFRESIFGPILLIVYIVLYLRRGKNRWEWLYPVITIGLFTGGYILLTVEDRYFWYVELLLLLIAFRALELVFQQKTLSRTAQFALIAVLVLSFAVGPLRALRGHFRRDAGLYATVQALKQSGKLNEPFASCEDWAHSAYIAYMLQEAYYGVIFPEPDADEIAHELNPDFKGSPESAPTAAAARRQLTSMHIRGVLVWADCAIDASSLGAVTAEAGGLRLVEAK